MYLNINTKMIHHCSYCNYESSHKWVLKTHMENKHGNQNTQNNQVQEIEEKQELQKK